MYHNSNLIYMFAFILNILGLEVKQSSHQLFMQELQDLRDANEERIVIKTHYDLHNERRGS